MQFNSDFKKSNTNTNYIIKAKHNKMLLEMANNLQFLE